MTQIMKWVLTRQLFLTYMADYHDDLASVVIKCFSCRSHWHIVHVHIMFACECEHTMRDCVRVSVSLAAALAVCKYSLAEWNVTDELANRTVSHCLHHGNGDNCTGRYKTEGCGAVP